MDWTPALSFTIEHFMHQTTKAWGIWGFFSGFILPSIFVFDLLPSYNESNITMKIYAVLSNINVDASCLYAALN